MARHRSSRQHSTVGVPTLPPLFVVLASHAVHGDGFHSCLEELLRARGIVGPMIKQGRFDDTNLLDMALTYAERFDDDVLRDGAALLLEDPPRDTPQALMAAATLRRAGLSPGVYVGLVAGYLIAQIAAVNDVPPTTSNRRLRPDGRLERKGSGRAGRADRPNEH